MPELRIGSYNGAYYKRVDDDDLRTLLPQVDIIGFQEFSRAEDRASLRKFSEFASFVGEDIGTPVAWRKDRFVLLAKGSHYLSPRTDVGPSGAGPNVMNKKHLTWVKLQDKITGRIFYFGNAHLVPSIYIPIRRRLHEQQTSNIRNWAVRKPNNVIFTGDFNIDHKQDAKQRKPGMPFKKFGAIGIHSNWRTLGTVGTPATAGSRYIDYVWYRLSPIRLKPVSQKVIRGLSSDHRALIVTFDVSLTLRKRLRLGK